MLLMKIGKREHLESLRDGNIYFSPLSRFRIDGTLFRGDRLEGKAKVDISRGFWVNGINISDYMEEVTCSYAGSDDILIFCAAILDDSNMQVISQNQISINREFLDEMKKFGRYAVIFEREAFIDCVTKKAKEYQLFYGYRHVTYIDKNCYDDITTYFQENKDVFGNDAMYFLKDNSYVNQHEWRYLLDYVPSEMKNEDGSYILNVSGLPVSNIIDLDAAVDELR